MPKLAKPLTDVQVRNAKPKAKTYTMADGDGMYLEILSSGKKIWRMAYRQANAKNNRLTFGHYPEVSLQEAREKRLEARRQLTSGLDPALVRQQKKLALATAATNSFQHVAIEWFEKTDTQRAPSTRKKVSAWLNKDLFPYIGKLPVSTIRPTDILHALRKMEERNALESAHRVKQICGQILRYAVATGRAERDVTADLRGALSPPIQTNHAAIIDPSKASILLKSIEGYRGHPYAVAALKLAPLVFVRPGELRTAEWAEIDLDEGVWRIPASKMKMKVEHMVPLANQAIEILKKLRSITGHNRFVFPSIRTNTRCMSENTINAALRSMGFDKETMTAHGFRAMARTIMDEVLGERTDLIEHQLAHAVRDPNGRAYNRTAHLPARKEMMQRWADYLDTLRT